VLHRRILSEKPVMLQVFREFYDGCMRLDHKHFSGSGLRVEIGAGSSLFKQFYPDVLATDIKPVPGHDRVVDALAMPFDPASVRAVYAINCFHHLPSPHKFFLELERVLAPGGGCVLIEPHHGPLAAALFRRMFATEIFDPAQPEWESPVSGAMTGANQALSYIVFLRDRARFERLHPSLEIVEQRPLTNWMRYLLSGGLNFRSLIPAAAAPLVKGTEWLASPLARTLALHKIIAIRKRDR